MFRPLISLAAMLLVSMPILAQAAPDGSSQAVPVLHVGTNLVIVDVVAQDKDGHPIHGLKREDFVLTENKDVQTIRNFDEHSSSDAPVAAPKIPPQPAGVFTDYTPVPPNGVLNVLLLDSLNTPTNDQAYVRLQLQDYVKKAVPGTRIAILGLSTRLFFLQGFMSDPMVLKDAVTHKLMQNPSSLLTDATGSNSDSTSMAADAVNAGMGPSQILGNLQGFDAEHEAFKTRLRMEYTLDAFDVLGHYLSAFPGRKNLVWFSGSFPLTIMPDLTLANPFAVMGGDMETEYRETLNLLTRAQIAVYPVDARGIMADPSLDAAKSGAGYSKKPQAFVADANAFSNNQTQSHQTMLAIASDTGGEAFFNTNDLATAVSKAINSGSNFYTLTYSPSHHSADGEYRNIKVELTKTAMSKGIKLSYRQGYFADDPTSRKSETASVTDSVPSENRAAATYSTAAMSRGAPMPSDILFRVRVLPASTSVEADLAPDNKPDPKSTFKGPYRRYDVDISAEPGGFEPVEEVNGKHTDKIEFTTFVFDNDGKLLNLMGKTVSLDLTKEQYENFKTSKVGFHLEVSAPARGDSFLRIGIHEVPANRFGVVEVPTSAVIKLPPPVYPRKK